MTHVIRTIHKALDEFESGASVQDIAEEIGMPALRVRRAIWNERKKHPEACLVIVGYTSCQPLYAKRIMVEQQDVPRPVALTGVQKTKRWLDKKTDSAPKKRWKYEDLLQAIANLPDRERTVKGYCRALNIGSTGILAVALRVLVSRGDLEKSGHPAIYKKRK